MIRKELAYMVLFNAMVLISILYFTFNLLTLAFDDTLHDAFMDYELNPDKYIGTNHTSYLTDDMLHKPQLIPKILHQTYKTVEIPEHWKEGRQRCIDLHPDYEYILWTDQMALDFIEEQFPWFLDTFKNYRYPIERADAIRYFVLYHYGGVYLDLDDGCQRSLDPLLTAPAFLRKTSPTGVSNDVMGSVPGHPFYLKVMKSLKKYDRNWYVPYVTIMSSTGPLFISIIWKQYKREENYEHDPMTKIKILQPADYKMHTYSFFTISKGSSWHMGDAVFVKSLASHILACVVAGFVLVFSILYSEYCFYCWLSTRYSQKSKSSITFTRLETLNDEELKSSWFIIRQISNFISRIKSYFASDEYSNIGDSTDQVERLRNTKRSRKDSNLPFLILMEDLEKDDPKFTDLSR